MGVVHPERARDPRPNELVERSPAGALHDASQDVGIVAVHEPLAGVRHERQGAERVHAHAHGHRFVGGVPSEASRRTEPLGAIPVRHDGIRAVRNAGRVREQILDGDRPARRHECHARIGALCDGGAREGRHEATGRRAKREAPLLHEHQHGGAGQRLRLRCDPEDRVGRHWHALLAITPPRGALVHDRIVAQYERNESADLFPPDNLGEHGVDARQSVNGETMTHRDGARRIRRAHDLGMASGGGEQQSGGGAQAAPDGGGSDHAAKLSRRRPRCTTAPAPECGGRRFRQRDRGRLRSWWPLRSRSHAIYRHCGYPVR